MFKDIYSDKNDFKTEFEIGDGIVKKAYCTSTGKLATESCPKAYGWYDKDSMPEYCSGGHSAPETDSENGENEEVSNMDGTYGYRCDECRALADEIQLIQNIDVQFEDERLTTVMAHNFLNTTDTRGKKRKAVVDTVSAVLILESYINKRNNSR